MLSFMLREWAVFCSNQILALFINLCTDCGFGYTDNAPLQLEVLVAC